MSDSDIQIDLDQPWAECGGYITGTVSWSGTQNPRSARVTLRYKTHGRGDTDKKDVSEIEVHTDSQGYHQFQLPVPAAGPVSFDGNLISLLYEVQLRLDLKGRRDPKTDIRVEILPRSV